LIGLGSNADFSSVVSMAELIETSQPLVDGMKEAYETGAKDNVQEGYGASIEETFANAALSQQIATVNEFNSTTQDQIVSALTEASILENDSGDVDIALKAYLAYTLIKAIFNKLRDKRRKLIIDTAILGSYNMGVYDSAVSDRKQFPSLKKTWLSMQDDKVRLSHRILNRNSVPVAEPFIVEGIPIRFPKDPVAPPSLTINCRCFLKFSK
tara:strand:+ start:29999 stop:30631 length:633 start_codon:yes stop_codon:yes gene_type:complete